MYKRFKKLNGYTCGDINKFLKISPSYYSQLENGRRILEYSMAVKISSLFKLQPDDIFYGEQISDKIVIHPKHKKLKVYSFYS